MLVSNPNRKKKSQKQTHVIFGAEVVSCVFF